MSADIDPEALAKVSAGFAALGRRARVIGDVLTERNRQIEKGYDTAHDVLHGAEYLIGEAVARIDAFTGPVYEVQREKVLEAAALLVAALEVIDAG